MTMVVETMVVVAETLTHLAVVEEMTRVVAEMPAAAVMPTHLAAVEMTQGAVPMLEVTLVGTLEGETLTHLAEVETMQEVMPVATWVEEEMTQVVMKPLANQHLTMR